MRRFLLQILIVVSPFVARSQNEVTYSQYMFNNLLINPAYAGYKEDLNINLLSRNQWVGLKGAPTTQSLIVDGAFFNNNNVGLGLSILNDRVGIQGQTAIMANYAYRLPVGEQGRLSFGVGVGAVQFSLNSDKAIIGDQTDPSFSGVQNYLSPDAKIGVHYSDNIFYAGLSANNLLTTALNKNNQRAKFIILPPVHIFLTVGALVNVNEDVKFKPSLMLRDDPNTMGNFDVNASFLFKDMLWIGGSYRVGVDMWKKTNNLNGTFQQNSLVGLVEVFVAKKFRIGYAYDYSLSDLNSYSSGSHEISLGLVIGKNYRNNALTTPRYF
ncbi:type IX secretion system membrane protein PorP/SprF [Pedobacter sp.]|uniref:PorP/SprF family type IX secretion system membrane protein n=1 Tax=Pedobacter sp. TaxID=1411316 RepID=UPI0031E41F6F